MSQFFTNISGSNLPPSIPTTFTEDSGSAVPVANNLNVLGDTTIATSGSGDTVTVSFRFSGTGTSTNGSDADLITFALGATPTVYRFHFEVAGRETTTGDGVGYTLFSSFKTDGATASSIQTPFIDADEDIAGASLTMVASGNSVILRALSSGTTTITYKAVGYYTSI